MSVINTNVKSLIAQDSLRANNNKLATAMERLSTGSRINSAKDDAAGLAIGTRMTAQVRGLNMAIKNANDGLSLAQTAEGAMTEVTDMLQRMRELAVQAGNSTNSDADRAAMNDEVKQLKSEINRIASTTQFNGMNIMDGSFQGKKLQIGNNADQTMELGVKSVSTSAMGETAAGLATGATRASVNVSGIANSAAAYSGVSFNATVNGQTTTVTLPTAAAVNPTVQKAFVATEAATSIKPIQVGAFAERTIDISTYKDIKIAVNDGDLGTQNIDIKAAATTLGYDATKLTGDQFVKSLQSAIDSSVYFTGDNKVTVGLDANNNVTFAVAGGAKKIAVGLGASAGAAGTSLLTKLNGASANTDMVSTGTPLSMKTITSSSVDSDEVFGLKKFSVAQGVNDSLGITVGSGQKVTLDLVSANTSYDNMSDVAALIQSKIDASGNFQGNNSITVSAVKNEKNEWGLTFQNSTNQKIVLDGNFMTAASGVADSSNTSAQVLPAGTSSISLTAEKQFGQFSEKTINLSGLKASDGSTSIATAMTSFKLNVNGGGDVTLDVGAALTEMGKTETVTTSAVTKDQFLRAMQTTINDSGLFAGDNAVTVGTNDKGMVTFTVAGGSGSIVVKENSATTSAATKYDGLIFALTGTNNGVVGGALDQVVSGGSLTLGAAYNANIASTATKPAGSIALTMDATSVAANPLILNLTDSQGNVTKITTAALTATTAPTASLVTDAIKTPTSDAGNQAQFYTASVASGVLTIKRTDGQDFTVQLDSADTSALKLTADSTSASVLVKGGAAASSSQLVNPFGLGTTRMGAGEGGTQELVKSQLGGTFASGDTIVFDDFTYTVSNSQAGAYSTSTGNVVRDAFISAYNQSTGAAWVASAGTDGQIVMTAKDAGNKSNTAGNAAFTATGTTTASSVATDGNDPTYSLENTLSLKVGTSSAPIEVKVASADFEYNSLSQLQTQVQSAIDATPGLQGDNRVVVGLTTDPLTGKSGLTFTQASGQNLEVAGTFLTKELKESQALSWNISTVKSGGVDLSSNNTVSVSIANADTGTTVTKDIVLASSSKNVSLSDYASLLQSGINSAFGNDGYSVTAASANGQFSLGLNQTGAKTITVSGASVNAALGSTVSATGNGANSLSSMDDVVAEMNKDLAAIGAEAHYDAASNSMSFSVKGGDAGATSAISLSGAGLSSVQFGGTLSATGAAGNATAAKLADIDVLSTDHATAALSSIDNSIQYISDQRANLGAIQNRLEHTVNNLTNIVTNTEASRSRIMDADYSKETTNLAKSQILTQAATAMLAQANQSAQGVLSLLK